MVKPLIKKTKTVSAKIPVDLFVEFEKVKAEYFASSYQTETMTNAIILGIEESIRQMKEKFNK